MIVDKTGKYRLLENWHTSGLGKTTLKKAGQIIEIIAVDPVYKKVMGTFIDGWEPWNMPVERIE